MKKVIQALKERRPPSMVGDLPDKSQQRHPDNQSFMQKWVVGIPPTSADYQDGPEVNRRAKRNRY